MVTILYSPTRRWSPTSDKTIINKLLLESTLCRITPQNCVNKVDGLRTVWEEVLIKDGTNCSVCGCWTRGVWLLNPLGVVWFVISRNLYQHILNYKPNATVLTRIASLFRYCVIKVFYISSSCMPRGEWTSEAAKVWDPRWVTNLSHCNYFNS